MPRASLDELLESNHRHVERLAKAGHEHLPKKQRPPVVSVCCSDSRVSQEGMWSVDEPGWLFSVGNIGNQAWDVVKGERVVAGSLAYPLHATETRTVVVVGHTGCGAIDAALDAHEGTLPELPGIRSSIEPLVPVVEEAFQEGLVREDEPRGQVRDKLVEANVNAQVDFLLDREEVPDEADILGVVYDMNNAYGGPAGRVYLVNADGERDREELLEKAGAWEENVASLFDPSTAGH